MQLEAPTCMYVTIHALNLAQTSVLILDTALLLIAPLRGCLSILATHSLHTQLHTGTPTVTDCPSHKDTDDVIATVKTRTWENRWEVPIDPVLAAHS